MTGYRATDEQWGAMYEGAFHCDAESTCLLELRARVEALEARRPASKVYDINEPLQLTPEQAQHVRDLLAPNSKPTPNPSQIRSSLVERVARAIHPDRCADPNLYLHEARAAICEVAAWLRDGEGDHNTIRQLEMQADATTSQED